jgi:hypothetical protein
MIIDATLAKVWVSMPNKDAIFGYCVEILEFYDH